jgi:hypothetical protein
VGYAPGDDMVYITPGPTTELAGVVITLPYFVFVGFLLVSLYSQVIVI